MTQPSEHEALSMALQEMANIFDVKLDPEKAEVYIRALRRFTLPEIRKAFQRCIESQDYFPRPAVIIKTILQARPAIDLSGPIGKPDCEYCQGVGFITSYLRLNEAKMKEHNLIGKSLPSSQQCIEWGVLEYATEEDYMKHNGRVASYAKRCICRDSR